MKQVIALVGMPGAGKTEAASFLAKMGMPFVRLGEYTEEELKRLELLGTPKAEEQVREDLRKKHGMAAYAIWAEKKIEALVVTHDIVVLDGLYSWEECLYLKKVFPQLMIIALHARPSLRYERLSKRAIRSFTPQEGRERDYREIEHINKAGPIAMADYMICNDGEKEELYKKLDKIIREIQ